MADPIRIALIGTGRRSFVLYGRLLEKFPGAQLVSVWGRRDESARRLGEQLGVPWYTDINKLVSETAPQIGIVSVQYAANGEVGLMAVEAGLNVLLETPIAHKLTEADAIIKAAKQRNLKIEIAEQFYRRPMEQIKLALIASGLFGRVHTSFNDFSGHGYHGVSVMRSYLGFDAKPVKVTGAVREFPLESYYSRLANNYQPRNENQEHGIIEFDDGRLGIFHWTSVAYDSPLRWWRSSRFLAEKGMGLSVGMGLDNQELWFLSLLAPGGEAQRMFTVERRWERNDGGALVAMVAHTGDRDQPIVRWDNPLLQEQPGLTPELHDDEIAVGSCILSLMNALRDNEEPSYGAEQGRLDQEIILAIRESSKLGQPVTLPLDPAKQTV
jgi:predicted dehydrogenase